jgi:hypothetical protein
MAFLDNSGDIILDAVLTDAGRQRLARGNFKVVKFALGDEEINYKIFNGSHPSGSAFYDLEIMQTPVLEAFTNNTSMMKSKLISMTRNNILYMPTFKINDNPLNKTGIATAYSFDGYLVAADLNTEKNALANNTAKLASGVFRGQGAAISTDDNNHIAIDQGIDSSDGGISFRTQMPDDLVETAFLVRCDHRLLSLHQVGPAGAAGLPGSTTGLPNQFIDDDGIAVYYLTQGDGTTCVEGAPRSGAHARQLFDARSRGSLIGGTGTETMIDIKEKFAGPLGSILRFYPRTSTHVRASSALFDEIGNSATNINLIVPAENTADAALNIPSYKYIDTLINVVGITTGYSIDIPIRIIKKV